MYVTLNAIGSFQCNLCSHWLIQFLLLKFLYEYCPWCITINPASSLVRTLISNILIEYCSSFYMHNSVKRYLFFVGLGKRGGGEWCGGGAGCQQVKWRTSGFFKGVFHVNSLTNKTMYVFLLRWKYDFIIKRCN